MMLIKNDKSKKQLFYKKVIQLLTALYIIK